MAVAVRVERLLNHELKKQITEAAAHLTRDRIIVLQRGGTPQSDEERSYQKLFAAMQDRGLGGVCHPAPVVPPALQPRRQQQHPMFTIERSGPPHPVRVPNLYGNH